PHYRRLCKPPQIHRRGLGQVPPRKLQRAQDRGQSQRLALRLRRGCQFRRFDPRDLGLSAAAILPATARLAPQLPQLLAYPHVHLPCSEPGSETFSEPCPELCPENKRAQPSGHALCVLYVVQWSTFRPKRPAQSRASKPLEIHQQNRSYREAGKLYANSANFFSRARDRSHCACQRECECECECEKQPHSHFTLTLYVPGPLVPKRATPAAPSPPRAPYPTSSAPGSGAPPSSPLQSGTSRAVPAPRRLRRGEPPARSPPSAPVRLSPRVPRLPAAQPRRRPEPWPSPGPQWLPPHLSRRFSDQFSGPGSRRETFAPPRWAGSPHRCAADPRDAYIPTQQFFFSRDPIPRRVRTPPACAPG